MNRVLRFLLDHTLLLVCGAGLALAWVNADAASYGRVTRALAFVVNDIGMVFFFALAAKEVYEAALPGGPLANVREGAVPIVAAVGGMVVPALLFLAGVGISGHHEYLRGWAIPSATDVAFSYLAARLVFGARHPAIPFLLLLAIADDAIGLVLIAVCYPSGVVAPLVMAAWLAAGVVLAWLLRRRGVTNFWFYVAGPGLLSWIGFYNGGLHPALALVPIVPFMPHARFDLGVADRPSTTIEAFESWWRTPVQLILFVFGLANAGVPFSSAGPLTIIVAIALVVGKPLGIVAASWIAARIGFRLPEGLNYRVLTVLGVTAGIGFTVALFFASAAFPAGTAQDQAKMGALVSVGALPVAVGLGRVLLRGRLGVSLQRGQ